MGEPMIAASSSLKSIVPPPVRENAVGRDADPMTPPEPEPEPDPEPEPGPPAPEEGPSER